MFTPHRRPTALTACTAATLVAGLFLPPGVIAASVRLASLAPVRDSGVGLPRPLPATYAAPHRERIVVVRDPFAGGDVPDPVAPGALSVRVANAGTAGAPTGMGLPGEATAGTKVLATVLGRTPYALVDEGGGTRFVRIGDPLAGSTVAAIRLGAIALASGDHLAIGAR